MSFERLPGPSVPVTIDVIPGMAELITRDGYDVVSGTFCEHHGFGILILADRDTLQRRAKAEDIQAEVRCLFGSFKDALLGLADSDSARERKVDHD